jgi:hypothetical protein
MPCDTITTSKLDLSKASADVLSAALVSLGFTLQTHTTSKIVATMYGSTVTWIQGKGTTIKSNDRTLTDKIPQAYAAATLTIAAKRNNWTVKQTDTNKYQVIRR